MTNVIPFDFKGNSVRVMEIDGEPWFVAVDVCRVLGLKNPSMAIKALDEDEVTLSQIEGSHRPTNLINESGLFALILRSDKPEAKPFRKWVTSDVLPAIRKTGGYGKTDVAALTRSDLAQMILDAERERETLAIQNAEQQCQIVNMRPKAEAHDRFLSSDGLVNLRTAMREIGARPNLAIGHLREQGVFFKEGLNSNTPKANLLARGYFEVRPSPPDRNGKVYPQTFVTPLGLGWLDTRIPNDLRVGGAA